MATATAERIDPTLIVSCAAHTGIHEFNEDCVAERQWHYHPEDKSLWRCCPQQA